MISDDDDYFLEHDYYYTDSDHDWYDDYDDDEIDLDDYAMCGMVGSDMDYEPYRKPEMNERLTIYKELNIPNPDSTPRNPLPLLDICASKIALNYAFAYIEDRNPPIPENVQLKIISYSFPQNMEKIKRYCALNNGSSCEFDKAIKIVKSVKDLTQIGFHLSANVECREGYREVWYGGPPGKKPPHLYVNVKFDRGKITETNCPCENSGSWCFHVIAVCLARIFLQDKCVMKPPLSDSLNNLTTYAQLRTFTQYLIAEFSDRRIVESAQNVLDRMMKPEKCDENAIYDTWGAPDPTAGPGLDEISHWLICEEGLKSRCTSLINSSSATEGCWEVAHFAEVDSGQSASVWERWRMTQIEEPVVKDYFDNLDSLPGNTLYSYNHCKKTYSRERGQEIMKFLKTCEELLLDDFTYSLKAVQTFTVQLMDTIEERNRRNAYRAVREKVENNFHLACTPRPQPCWLFRDQLARLWRLLVLNPSISAKDREGIFTTLEVLEAKLHSTNGQKQYLEWDSPKHIEYLKSFTWESLQLSDDPFKDDNRTEMSVLRSAFLECTVSRSRYLRNPEQFPFPQELGCGNFASSVTVYCYLVEALSVYGKKDQAVHLAMNLALAIVRYYSSWLEGSLPVDPECTLYIDQEEKQENETGKKGKAGKNKKRNRKRGRLGTKKVEEEQDKSNEMVFDQIKGVIAITSVAYLMDILEQHQELLAEMLKLVKLRGLGLSEDELMECDDVTSDAKSLIFRLGVVGLGMPKIRAPSVQIQLEWFNWEVSVSQKLLRSSPSAADVEFLKMFTIRTIGLCESGFHPPHALVMNLFHHSYTAGARQSDDGVSVAMRTIVASPPGKANGLGVNRRIFLECQRRHAVKLCEVVLCRVSLSRPQLNHALECLFTATDTVGSTAEGFDIKLEKKATLRAASKKSSQNADNPTRKPTRSVQNTRLAQGMLIEKVVANLYLAHALVSYASSLTPEVQPDAKSEKQADASSKAHGSSNIQETLRRRNDHFRYRHAVAKVQDKKANAPLTEQQHRLYETAITFACRAFAVRNFKCHELQIDAFHNEYDFTEFMQRSLKWMCNINDKIGVKAFDLILEKQRIRSGPVACFHDDELIKLCTLMLESEQKREDRVWLKVRDALLTMIRPESHKKISDMLILCRNVEKEPPRKRLLIVPAICKEILLYVPGSTLEASSKLDYLYRGVGIMHSLCKKLEVEEESGDNLEGVKELFSDSPADKPSTSNGSSERENLDPNLQLCFDLAIETVKNNSASYRSRSYELKKTYETTCNVVVYVARRASKLSGEQPADDAQKGKSKAEPFDEVYVNRFIEILCTSIKDYLLLTDFFFELSSKLLNLQHRGTFGQEHVLLSDDLQLAQFTKSCSSLSVLLKRCIAGLVETTKGEDMEKFMKETREDSAGHCKMRAKGATFYCGSTLVAFLNVVKRLMGISQDDDFEPFSYKLASKHPVTKAAVEEVNNKDGNSSADESSVYTENQLISSLLLRRMFSPALSFFDCDEDSWRY